VHSILIDPRDPAHMYLATSDAGVFESTDNGRDWHCLNKGCVATFLPDPTPEFGYDPHCVRIHPLAPDILRQQPLRHLPHGPTRGRLRARGRPDAEADRRGRAG
jgi:hypothetical protein